ncbi:MAG TPA: hypothetical protein VGX27_11620 [Candidatus Dormibacteraeota bacterium]|nr:hypothetical protein [Candidatus Dormibacteraeota bacterium]
MVNPSVRLRVWASQLANDDFPPVCVYSGEPADAWWRIRLFTPYRWAVPLVFLSLLLVIGFVIGGALGYLLARRVSGHLPMRAQYARRLWMLPRVSAAILAAGVVMLVAALHAPPLNNVVLGLAGILAFTVSPIFILIGLLGVQIGLQVAWNPLAPRGKVFARKPGDPDRIVEISNVHPAFVAAAQAMYSARSPHPGESK